MRYFATYLIYIATIARAIGWHQETFPIPFAIWFLLGLFGVVLLSQQALTHRFPLYPRVYIFIQSGLVVAMLYSAPSIDFLLMLFLPLCFQVVQFFPSWIGFTWIGICILAASGTLLLGLEWQAGLTMILTAIGMGFLMGSFAYLISRTEQRRVDNQRMYGNLQQAYRQLKDSAAQAEALASATERHRLVRELHDSLTQTIFGMNLAVQSAQLSIAEDPLQSKEHLARLQTLTRNATSEVQALIGQAPRWSLAQVGLEAAIRHLADEKRAQDGLNVSFEAIGKRELPELVAVNLFRITQEALNNIIHHAGVQHAMVRLCLDSPFASLEIIDKGCGFDMASSRNTTGYGLAGMAERAAEIGWEFEIKSYKNQGTKIRVQEKVREGQ